MSKAPAYFDQEDEDVMQPLCGNEKSPLDLAREESNEGTSRNLSKRQKLFISCFVGVSLMVVVVVCVVMTRKNDSFLQDVGGNKRIFSINDAFRGGFFAARYELDWVSDHSYLHSSGEGVLEYDMENVGKNKVIVTPLEKYASNMDTKILSADRKWLLFSNNTTPLYRHSSYADYYLKNIASGKIQKIRTPNNDAAKIRYCTLSTTGEALVLVHKCNIYYSLLSNLGTYYQLTDSGVPKKVFNGVPDWVYEEEIINSGHAMEFSPKGKYLSYVTFDATLVPFYRFPKYGPASRSYPTIEKIAYPKAGFPNPTIKITVIDLVKAVNKGTHAKTRHQLTPPSEFSKGEYYYAAMEFNKENQVFIQWMNRAQNKTICMLYDVMSGVGKKVEYHNTPGGWIDDDYVKPSFSKDGRYYITMLPADAGREKEKGKFRHLVKVDVDKGNVPKNKLFLTSGAYTVHDINCWDPDQEIVYFRSTEGSPRHRHVYSYNVKTKEKKCVSCGKIKDSADRQCTYYMAEFSKMCSWMVLHCKGPIIPQSRMIGLKSSKDIVLVDNKRLKEKLEGKDVPVFVYYTVKSGGYDIAVREIRPKNFDKNKKYPVLFDVYGGPNTQKVTDKFTTDFFDWTFVGRDIIVVNFDARGAGYYGYKHMYAVYRNLGKYEAIDALAVAKHLQTKSYVDKTKIAIWGWSYGGFYAATTLAMSPKGIINTALSVAPVTDWRYYDTVYSERYMALPSKEDNLGGYERTSVMAKANNFLGKNFMLIHGTGDDNVHFQNSAQLAAALINAQVDFKSQFYTDKRHGIHSGGHVYYAIADFLLTKLKGKDDPVGRKFGWY